MEEDEAPKSTPAPIATIGPMILVFQHSESGPLGTVRSHLNAHALRLREVRVHRNEPIPEDLDDVDAIISLGGPQSANDASPALEREMRLLKTAHACDLPILGICLGSQLLARALGGEVTRLPAAEIGWHEVTLSPVGREDPLFFGIGWRTAQFHWHSEHVSRLPGGARTLASSKACPVQAWGAGLRAYGIQFHPEVDEGTIRRWLREDAIQLAPAGATSEQILSSTVAHLADMTRLTERLVGNWVNYVVARGTVGARR